MFSSSLTFMQARGQADSGEGSIVVGDTKQADNLIFGSYIGGRNGNNRGDRRRHGKRIARGLAPALKTNGNEMLTVTIAKRKTETAAKTGKKPNATFGMWADRADVNNPAAYVRALRQTRASSRRSAD